MIYKIISFIPMGELDHNFPLPKEFKPFEKIEYRSPKLKRGDLNKVGVPHMHIDGARNPAVVYEVVKELADRNDYGKFNYVVKSIGGKQREELPEIYESHTPAIEGQESLDFFSSNIVQDRADAIYAVNLAAERIKNIPGAIIELEQVVGWYDGSKWIDIDAQKAIEPINPEEVNFKPMPTWPYEIHHGFNLPKDSDEPPIDLEALRDATEKAGIVIGGWFIFAKDNEWAYRSNSFSNADDVHSVVEREQAALNTILQNHGKPGSSRTLVERVLGIWHSGE